MTHSASPENILTPDLETASDFEPEFDALASLELSVTDGCNAQLSILKDDRAEMSEWDKFITSLSESVETAWHSFAQHSQDAGIPQRLGLRADFHTLSIEVSWVSNHTIQHFNRDYRDKDAATDVLTFTLMADSPDTAMWLSLPEVQMGSIFVSLPWAKQAVTDAGCSPDAPRFEHCLRIFVMERVIHGWLHLHGQHHDTMPDFERVVSIQKQVLSDVFTSEYVHQYRVLPPEQTEGDAPTMTSQGAP